MNYEYVSGTRFFCRTCQAATPHSVAPNRQYIECHACKRTVLGVEVICTYAYEDLNRHQGRVLPPDEAQVPATPLLSGPVIGRPVMGQYDLTEEDNRILRGEVKWKDLL